MPTHATDRAWEHYGATDPYYGVIAHDEFRRDHLDEAARERFFERGAKHVEWVLESARRIAGPDWAPRRVLDFGCGVGRLVVPFAACADRVTGLDVSPSMLEEAKRNCIERRCDNVDFVLSDDALSHVDGTFDLIHSHIVFQHIPRRRGMRIIGALVDRLSAGGVGALHILHPGRPVLHGATARIVATLPGVRQLANALRPGRRASDPPMQMNPYDPDEVLEVLRSKGIERCELSHMGTGHDRGIMVFFGCGSST